MKKPRVAGLRTLQGVTSESVALAVGQQIHREWGFR